LSNGGDRYRFIRWLPWALLGIVSTAIAVHWFQRDLNHDDFFFAYTAWMRGIHAVPYRDFYVANFTVVSEVFAPFFRWFPESFLPIHIARAAILACNIAVCYLIYRVTRALGSTAAWGAVAVLLYLCQPDIILRIADVRADPIGAMFLMACALALLTAPEERVGPVSGIWFGLAITIAYKIALATPFVAVAVILRNRRHWFRALLLCGVCSAIAPLLYYALRLAIDGPQVVLSIWHDVLFGVATGQSNRASAIVRFMIMGPSTPVAIALGTYGYARAAILYDRDARRGVTYIVLVLGYIAVAIAMNPFLFPYNYLIWVPLLAPIVSGIPRMIARARMPSLEPGLLALTAVVVASYAALPIVEVTRRTNDVQIALVKWIWSSTTPGERIFDWQGMHFGRRGILHWWSYGGLQTRYEAGWYTLEDELRAARVSLLINNFRFAYMTPRDQEFVFRHYVRFAPCLMVPGVYASKKQLQEGGVTLDVFVPGTYRVLGEDLRQVRIDGNLPASHITLQPGLHRVEGVPGSTTDAAVLYTTPLREKAPAPCPGDVVLKGFN
jgi:hypothetical protein